MSLVLISHDIELIKRYCDEIVVMKKGLIIENQKTESIFRNPINKYTKDLVNFKSSIFREDIIDSNEKVLKLRI